MQTAVANVRAKTKYVSTRREQVCYKFVLVLFVAHIKFVYLAFSLIFRTFKDIKHFCKESKIP